MKYLNNSFNVSGVCVKNCAMRNLKCKICDSDYSEFVPNCKSVQKRLKIQRDREKNKNTNEEK